MKYTEGHRRAMEVKHLDPDYGRGMDYAPIVSSIADKLKVTELLDYGCGKAGLMRALNVSHGMKLQCYDPAVPGYAGEPVPMQMVTCIDVLGEVEPDCLGAVLDDLVRVTSVIGFYTIPEISLFWMEKIMARFDVQTVQAMPEGAYLIVYSKAKPMVETLQ